MQRHHGLFFALLAAMAFWSASSAQWSTPQLIVAGTGEHPVTVGGGSLNETRTRTFTASEDGDTLHTVWLYGDGWGTLNVIYKHSFNGGESWSDPVQLSSAAEGGNETVLHPNIAVIGTTVHVVWCFGHFTGFSGDGVIYRRSDDAGDTWTDEVYIAPGYGRTNSLNIDPMLVAVGERLHVTWGSHSASPGDTRSKTYYCTSLDGGQSWETPVQISEHSQASGLYCYGSAIAVAGDDIHMSWLAMGPWEVSYIFYRQSLDGGQTWEQSQQLESDDNESWPPNIEVTSGSNVHLVWSDNTGGQAFSIYYRRSSDRGVTWDDPVDMDAEAPGILSSLPVLQGRGSELHLIYNRIGADPNYLVHYRRSDDDGTTWGADTVMAQHTILPSLAATSTRLYIEWSAEFYSGLYFLYSSGGGGDSHRPSAFNLLTPANHSDLSLTEAESVTFGWETSVDPDSGQVVDYSLHIQVTEPGSPTVFIVHDGLAATEYTLNLLDESGFNPPSAPLAVRWWVTANSTGDTVHSTSTFRLDVVISQEIAVTSPNGNELWYIGDEHAVEWTSSGVEGTVRIELGHEGGHGVVWDVIAASTPNSGSYAWTVSGSVSTTARIRVSSVTSPEVADESDGYFEIRANSGRQPRENKAHRLALASPSPNPFNAMTELRFSVSTVGPVEVQIYGLLGNLVATPVRRRYEPGEYRVIFDATGLPTGTYFCRLLTREGTRVQKMLLTR